MSTSTITAGRGASLTEEPHRPPLGKQSPGGLESVATACALVVCVVAQLPQHAVAATGAGSWVLALIVAVAVVSGARAVVRTPLTLIRSLHAGPGRASAVRGWARTEATVVLLTVAAGTVACLPLYALMRATPAWWFLAWILFAAITVLWQLFMPLAIAARAGGLTPAPPELADRVTAIADLAGVKVGGVSVAGAPGRRHCNAYIVGLGPTRRLVLERELTTWSPELVDQVVAHELGHWRLGHTGRRLPLTLLAQLASLAAAAAVLTFQPLLDLAGVAGAGDPLSYPLLLVVGAVVALPARCLLAWRDRAQERAADRFALDLLDRPDRFAAMLQRVADDSGTARRLTWWQRLTASHPPIDERTAAVLSLDLRP